MAIGKSSGLPPHRQADHRPGRPTGTGGRSDRHARARNGDGDVEANRILVADDDDDFREIVIEILAMAGWRTLQAATGLAALDMVAREQPDIIMLDQRMPGLCGDEVIRHLRARNHRMPIVLVTAASDVAELARSLDLEFYLQKPVGIAQLESVLRTALARGGGRD